MQRPPCSHGSAAGIIFFRNGSLRCALFPEKKIPPAVLAYIVEARSYGTRLQAKPYQ